MKLPAILRLPLILMGLIAALIISLSNRADVLFSLDPFSPATPIVGFQLPLYVLLFGFLLLGVLIGGAAAWLGQTGWRKKARKNARDVRHLEKDLARASAGSAAREEGPATEAPQLAAPEKTAKTN